MSSLVSSNRRTAPAENKSVSSDLFGIDLQRLLELALRELARCRSRSSSRRAARARRRDPRPARAAPRVEQLVDVVDRRLVVLRAKRLRAEIEIAHRRCAGGRDEQRDDQCGAHFTSWRVLASTSTSCGSLVHVGPWNTTLTCFFGDSSFGPNVIETSWPMRATLSPTSTSVKRASSHCQHDRAPACRTAR